MLMKKTLMKACTLCLGIMMMQSCTWWWDRPHGPYGPYGPYGPGGGGGGGGEDVPEVVDPRIDNVVPDDIRDKMEDYMPIYNGTTPPNIENVYLVNPVTLVFDSFDNLPVGWQGATAMYMHFFNQNSTNNTLSYEMIEGNELAESSNSVYISGTGNNFTIYFNATGTALDNITVKQAIVISGTKSETGITNLYYGNVVISKSAESPYLLPDGSYRVFKDGDGQSEITTWPASMRAQDGVTADWSKSIFAVK